MKPKISVLILLLSVALSSAVVSAKQADAYSVCPSIEVSMERLACFDSYANHLSLTSSNSESKLILTSFEPVSLVSDSRATKSLEAAPNEPNYHDGVLGLLTSDGPNHIRIVSPKDNPNLKDDQHVEISLAFKYPLCGYCLGFFREKVFNKYFESYSGLVPDNVYLSYRGEHDFYALGGTRYDSSPIVSRNHVPGLAAEWEFGDAGNKSFIRLGAFHQSNGQSLNNKPSKLSERFSLGVPLPLDQDSTSSVCQELIGSDEFANFNIGKQRFEVEQCRSGSTDFALAQVSRAYNFLQLQYRYLNVNKLNQDGLLRYQIELRTYDDTHDEIFWDRENPSQIEDYDGLRMSMDWAFHPTPKLPLLFRAELKAGTSSLSSLKNSGGKVSLGIDKFGLVTSGFYFNGFGREPSTYHRRTKYWGVEFELR